MNLADGIELAAFFNQEDVIAKIQSVHNLERESPYEYAKSPSYWDRVRRSLDMLPAEFRAAALAIFSNVIYVGSELLEETLRHVAREVAEKARDLGYDVPSDVHVFTVDHPGLIDDLYRVGGRYGWTGRLDDLSLRSIRSTSDFLYRLGEASLDSQPDDLAPLRLVAKKKIWLLLTDNALSGGSAKSDLDRLTAIRNLLFDGPPPHILLGVQILSHQAEQALCASPELLHTSFGIRIDSDCGLRSDTCSLFSSSVTLDSARKLCDWFGSTYFPVQLEIPDSRSRRTPSASNVDEAIALTLRKHREAGYDPVFRYGWYDGGYTLVTAKNCPTNSIPLLWYPMVDAQLPLFDRSYTPPFPRNPSRKRQVVAHDSERLKRVLSKGELLRKVLEGEV
jgi:hypothetical protein